MYKKYYFDKAKTNEQEDLLGYTKFLDQIFAYIEYFLSKNDSTIIGLAANWGDGKTTVINFLKERIKSKYKNENKPKNVFNTAYLKALVLKEMKHIVIYSVIIFAASVTVYLNYKDNIVLLTWLWCFIFLFIIYKAPNWQKSVKKIKNSIFLEKDYIILDFECWAAKDETQVIQEFLKTLSDKVDLADGSEDFTKYIKAILKYKNIDFNIFSNDDSITVLYDRLKNSLQNSNKKIIVFIDDMDRMTGKEIFCLLKLVKVVANFPNTLYILSYNKDYVAKELAQVINYKPEEYLEKIITNEYRLPNIKPEQISEILMTELDKIIGSDTDNYDRKNINILLEAIIPYYIPNLRKAYRILNAFNFHYALFLKAGVLINIADLLYLTVLKVFNLNLYNRIWNEKINIFVHKSFKNEEEKKKYEEKYIIGYIERESLSVAETIIMNKLFYDSYEIYDVKRLNNSNHFDLYFSYEIEKSQISKIKSWLLNFSPENPQADDFEHSKTMLSDLQDLMYSNLYYKYRDTNFALGLIELMIRNPKLAKELYVENTKFYFNGINQSYVKNANITEIAEFIDKNRTRCEINFLEWLLFDCLFYDGTNSLNPSRILTDELEKIKVNLQQELKTKLEKCNILDIYSAFTIERLIQTYGFSEIIKEKLLKLLQESDIAVVSALQQFTTVGHSSTVGVFYNLYIIDKIEQLGISENYRQRLLQIKENSNIMTASVFINYYAGTKEFAETPKQHIVDKAIDIIEKYAKHAAENTIDNK